jgi:hypothetical protein
VLKAIPSSLTINVLKLISLDLSKEARLWLAILVSITMGTTSVWVATSIAWNVAALEEIIVCLTSAQEMITNR